MEFFLNKAEHPLNSANLENLINHWSMNWVQFKDPVSHMCLAGAVVLSLTLTQEVNTRNQQQKLISNEDWKTWASRVLIWCSPFWANLAHARLRYL